MGADDHIGERAEVALRPRIESHLGDTVGGRFVIARVEAREDFDFGDAWRAPVLLDISFEHGLGRHAFSGCERSVQEVEHLLSGRVLRWPGDGRGRKHGESHEGSQPLHRRSLS